jgi:starvation-inducible outer membrane lipoprotein
VALTEGLVTTTALLLASCASAPESGSAPRNMQDNNAPIK